MELLFVVCAIFGFFALFAVAIGLSVYFKRRNGRRWAENARQLGLTLGPTKRRELFAGSGPSIHMPMLGERAGMPVEVGIKVVTTGSGENRQTTYYTYVRVSFPKPLDLGMSLSAIGFARELWQSVAGQSDLQVGDPEIDAGYQIRAVDADHVRAVVTTPYVREALAWMRDHAFRPSVDDDQVYRQTRIVQLDLGAISVALDGAVDLARRLVAARQQVGLSVGQRAVAEQWRLVAQNRGLSVDVEGTRMSGRVEGMHVEVDTQIRKGRRWTQFVVRFDRPFGLGLQLDRQHNFHGLGALFGMQDVATGDAAFDNRFVVRGHPPAAVQWLLNADVRALLSELLDQATVLKVEDDRLIAEVDWLVADPAALDAAIVTIVRAGAALAQVETPDAGPFR